MRRSRPLPVRQGNGRRGKPDPFDVEALEKSLNDAAERVSTLWISFLIFGLYLVVSAGAVTHRQLLLAEPVKLPVLNIDLPLVGFFFLAPILFVIFHAYMLLQVVLLGRKAAAYNEAVERRIKVAADNARLRQRLANALFAQIFAGASREGGGLLSFFSNTIAWITVVAAPVLVLLVFQFQFLPYHSERVTWALRILILIDLAIVFVLWPAAKNTGRDIALRGILRWLIALPIAIAVVAFAWIVLSFPSEPHAKWTRYYQSQEEREKEIGSKVKCRTKSPISEISMHFDRLYLPRVDVVDDEKLKLIKKNTKDADEPDFQGERTRNLRNRNFDCADLSDYADLRRVDLEGALLRGALFDESKLQGVSLAKAQLQGANLDSAQLQGANLDSAQLQGASLREAQLQGAILHSAQLQGAYLPITQLQGADLRYARLQGAFLSGADLRGVSLVAAQLHGAILSAPLQGADLNSAQLQGASLRFARLQGADLRSAQLQGAELGRATLDKTLLSGAVVWRARNADCKGAFVQNSHLHPIIQLNLDNEYQSVYATAETIAKFIDDAVAGISNSKTKENVADRMRAALTIDAAKDDTAEIAEVWRKCERIAAEVDRAEFDKNHATLLRDLVCDAKEDRGAIAKGIIRNWIAEEDDTEKIRVSDDFSAQLARDLLGENGKPCAATADLDGEDIDNLRAAIDTVSPASGSSSPSRRSSDAAPDTAVAPSGTAAAQSGAAAAPSPAQSSAPPPR